MEMSIIINIPQKEEVKNSALTSRAKQQNLSVVKSTLSVNSVLKKNAPVVSLSEQLTEVVHREFEKIKAPI
jgi:hypothetical protein